MNKLSVIDFFCGGGGFSEGFRQLDFEVVRGYDYWRPAVNTFNANFGAGKGILKNILDFEGSTDLIEELPDTDVILGSPPCVSFSSSNNSGKADKSLGVKLTEVFLRIVAVKKHHPESKLKAWFMENVTNSTTYLAREYNFKDLNLSDWAKKHRLSPKKIAIKIEGNSTIINSAEYGSAQIRKRVITGELIRHNRLLIPTKLHGSLDSGLLPFNNLSSIKSQLPKPNSSASKQLVSDPLYPKIQIPLVDLTDHFYDTGLYASEWKNSKSLKCNHPYMGKMSFPENECKPSRTITATKIGTSREALIYKSEFNRTGNGEYRTPTVREAACIMSFPITYQFIGTEGTKWRLVGNAVCPSVSRAFAKLVKLDSGLPIEPLNLPIIQSKDLPNLNTFKEKEFTKSPKRKAGSRFRRHPFKDGNLTVTLSNYDILSNDKKTGKWQTSVQYGSGEGFPSVKFRDYFFEELEPIIKEFENGDNFIQFINNGFSSNIAGTRVLQKMYEEQTSLEPFLEPTVLVEKVAEIIENYSFNQNLTDLKDLNIFPKRIIPKKQILALYALNKVCSIANNN